MYFTDKERVFISYQKYKHIYATTAQSKITDRCHYTLIKVAAHLTSDEHAAQAEGQHRLSKFCL